MPDLNRAWAAVVHRWHRTLDRIWAIPLPARPVLIGRDSMLSERLRELLAWARAALAWLRGAPSARLRELRAAVAVTTILALTVVAVVAAQPAPSRGGGQQQTAAVASTSRVLAYLHSISGRATVAGQHNREPLDRPTRWTKEVHTLTGRYPGLWGEDFAFEGEAERPAMVSAAIAQWHAGSLVTLMWHMCPPGRGQTCDFDRDVQSRLSNAQWQQLITDGTPLNLAWKHQIDAIVPLLQQLQAAGVEVLWRPLHESNASWAWWSGRPGPQGSAALFRILHDYLQSKGLTNLVWVWSVKDVDLAHLADYYPGDRYVDVVGLDSWLRPFPTQQTYDQVLRVAGSKPIALTEVGALPSPAQLAGQPRWTYFMVWAEMLTQRSSRSRIRLDYDTPRILTRDRVSLPASTH